MPLLISPQNLDHLTREQVLELCVKEYAERENYEPYEKDYGSCYTTKVPLFAKDKGEYARQVLDYLGKRNEFKCRVKRTLERVRVKQETRWIR